MQSAATARLEPLTLGMLLDRTIRLYVDNFSLMVGISAIAYLPYIALLAALTMVTAGMTGIDASNPEALQQISPSQIIAFFIGMFAVGVLMILWALVVLPFGLAATTKAVSERYLGNEITIGTAFRAAWNVWGRLLIAQFVAGLIVLGGIILVIVPGIIFALSYAVIAPVVVLESLSAGESRKRSWALVSGYRGRIFLFWLLMGVFGIVITGGVGVVLGMLGNSPVVTMATQLVNGGVQVLLAPLSAIAVTLFYYDFRVRKEGFDLDILRRLLEQRT